MTLITLIVGLGLVSAAPYQKTKTTKPVKSETSKNASEAQIAEAKAAGKVWVNTSTKVYHDGSSEFYGATKSGKFMSEKDAIEVGYRSGSVGIEYGSPR